MFFMYVAILVGERTAVKLVSSWIFDRHWTDILSGKTSSVPDDMPSIRKHKHKWCLQLGFYIETWTAIHLLDGEGECPAGWSTGATPHSPEAHPHKTLDGGTQDNT